MLAITNQQRYFLYREITDMRKGIDGLSGLVRNYLQLDPLSGDMFLFFNRPCNQVKMLMWDRDGFALYCKRLEKGTFELPKTHKSIISAEVLSCILHGIQLSSVRKRKRFEKAAA